MKTKRFMTKFTSVICICAVVVSVFLCTPILASASQTTPVLGVDYVYDDYYTEFNDNVAVPISRWIANYKTMDDHGSVGAHPSAVKINDTECTFNCFTYALIYDGNISLLSKLRGNQKFHINDPSLFITDDNPCLTSVTHAQAQPGDLVFYLVESAIEFTLEGKYVHIAILTDIGDTIATSTAVSKWAYYDVYSHLVYDTPYTSESNIVPGTPDPLMTVVLECFRPSHNYTYTAIINTPPRPTMPSTSTCHYAYCTGCGAYHYESHDYSNSTCRKCGYYTGTSINNIENEVTE